MAFSSYINAEPLKVFSTLSFKCEFETTQEVNKRWDIANSTHNMPPGSSAEGQRVLLSLSS